MAETSIQWTDHSINPIRAKHRTTGAVGHYCEKVSHGCTNCYASTLQKRFSMPPFPGAGRSERITLPLATAPGRIPVGEDVDLMFDESKLQEVLRRKKPTKYFWCDMTDLFGSWVPDEWIDRCFAVMALTPQHTHQVLTKRAERLRDYLSRHDIGLRWATICNAGMNALSGGKRHIAPDEAVEWTRNGLPNVHLGVSVENQDQAHKRIPFLITTPATVRFLSCEPLLGAVDLRKIPWRGPPAANGETPARQDVLRRIGYTTHDYGWPLTAGIDWCIVGGESGSGARPCDLEWIRSIVQQCKAAGVPCFVKQMGSRPFGEIQQWPAYVRFSRASGCPAGPRDWLMFHDKKGGDMAEWPEDLRVREFPEVSVG